MRPAAALLIPLLALSGSTALTAGVVVGLASSASAAGSLSAGYSQEHYSAGAEGALRWLEASAPAGAWTGRVRGESLRRFRLNDVSGAAGASWKGTGTGASVWVGGTSKADILPRAFVEAAGARSLGRGTYAEAAARLADYAPAVVGTGSLTLYWQAAPSLEVSARGGASRTDFKQAGTRTYPAFTLRSRFEPASAGTWGSVSAGYYKEAFESGAPGGTGTFSARVVGLEAGLRPFPSGTLRAGVEYEDRDNGTFVRRWSLGAGWSF